MKETYKINLSTIKLNNSRVSKKQYRINVCKKLLYILCRVLICTLTFFGVFYIFRLFDSRFLIGKQFLYTESITLGALFSTMGSSLVSITSIISEHCIKNIDLNIETLQSDQLGRSKKWSRWPFIDRVSKHNLPNNSSEYYVYNNPSISFCNLKKEISLPLSIKDFYELKIVRNYIVLKLKRKNYRKVLAFQPNTQYLKDILVWDCIMDVYKNIIIYKFHRTLSYCGWSIVISSIIFSFFYPNLITYFDSIIFTISTIWS